MTAPALSPAERERLGEALYVALWGDKITPDWRAERDELHELYSRVAAAVIAAYLAWRETPAPLAVDPPLADVLMATWDKRGTA